MIARLQHPGTTSGTEDEHTIHLYEVVRQRRGELIEIVKRLSLSLIPGDDRHRISIDKEPNLLRRFAHRIETHARRVAKWYLWALDHRDQPQGTGALLHHLGSADPQGLREPLVG